MSGCSVIVACLELLSTHLCRVFLAKVGARLSAALDAASAKHAQAVAEGAGLAALQALEAQLAPAAAAGAGAPAAEGADGTPAGALMSKRNLRRLTGSCCKIALLFLRGLCSSCIWSSVVLLAVSSPILLKQQITCWLQQGTPGALNFDACMPCHLTGSCIMALLCLRPLGSACIW